MPLELEPAAIDCATFVLSSLVRSPSNRFLVKVFDDNGLKEPENLMVKQV